MGKLNKLVNVDLLDYFYDNIKITLCTPINYNELVILRNNSKMVPGTQYRIIDFVTTTNGNEDSSSANHKFDIIVTALTSNTLSHEAKACYPLIEDDNELTLLSTPLSNYTMNTDTWKRIPSNQISEIPAGIKSIMPSNITEDNYDVRHGQFSKTFKKGVVKAQFNYVSGANRINCVGVDIVQNNTVIDSDYHIGSTGNSNSNNEYRLHVPSDGSYVIRYFIEGNTEAITASCNVNAKCYEQYFTNTNLESWQLLYDINNDNTKYAWAKTDGKGVIYYMKDEFFNEASYDFKNIKYNNYYTFDYIIDNIHYDGSIKYGNKCHHNKIGIDMPVNKFIGLSKIYFKNTAATSRCDNNIIENDCWNINFGDNCFGNKIGIGCDNLTFGNSVQLNEFDDYCKSISLGNNIDNINFGNNCTNIKISNSSNANINYCRTIKFGEKCSNLTLVSSNTTDSNNWLQNITVTNNLSGSITIDKLNDPINLFISKNSTGSIIKYYESDLVSVSNIKTINDESILGSGNININTKNYVEINYNDLKTLRNNGQLVPGKFYRIIDYTTKIIHLSHTTAGHNFDIIVKAVDEHTLDHDANIAETERLNSTYGIIQTASQLNINYAACSYMNNSPTDIKTVDYNLLDEYIKAATSYNGRWLVNVENMDNHDITNSKFYEAIKDNSIQYTDSTILNEIITYHQYTRDLEEGELEVHIHDIHYDIDDGVLLGVELIETTSNNIISYNYNYKLINSLNSFNYTLNVPKTDNYIIKIYKGNFIYNIKGKLAPGNGTVMYDCSFDIYNCHEYFNISCNVYDTLTYNYFSNNKLQSWLVKYDIDNDNTKYAWANTISGKGVIYYMKDEYDNECPYDFKNILVNGTHYTFSYEEDGKIYDSSLKSSKCYGNIINASHNSDGIRKLNSIVFKNTSINSYCNSNTFGYDCEKNTFGDSCISNTLGNYCSNNTFGNKCQYNTFDDYCQYNKFGNYFQSGTFGVYCQSNSFGSYIIRIAFGKQCMNNKFTNSSSGNDLLLEACRMIKFGDQCNGVNLYTTGGPSYNSNKWLQNITLSNALSGNIEVTELNNNQNLFVTKNSNGSIIKYYESDVIESNIYVSGNKIYTRYNELTVDAIGNGWDGELTPLRFVSDLSYFNLNGHNYYILSCDATGCFTINNNSCYVPLLYTGIRFDNNNNTYAIFDTPFIDTTLKGSFNLSYSYAIIRYSSI